MIFSLKMVVSPFQGKLLMEEIHTSHSTNWLACLEISGPREWKEDGLNTKVTFCLFTVEDYIVDGLSIEIWTQFGISHYSQWPHSYENYIESQLGWFMKTNQDRLDFGYFPDRQKHRSLLDTDFCVHKIICEEELCVCGTSFQFWLGSVDPEWLRTSAEQRPRDRQQAIGALRPGDHQLGLPRFFRKKMHKVYLRYLQNVFNLQGCFLTDPAPKCWRWQNP